MKNFLTILLLVLSLTGCSPSYNFMVTDITPSKQKINVNLNEISICPELPESEGTVKIVNIEECSKEQITSDITLSWGVALIDALKSSEMFMLSATRKASISVKILKVDVPFIGADFTTQVLSDYKLIDNVTRAILYEDIVKTEANVPWNYSFFAYKRARESINRAVQRNISQFIANLQRNGLKLSA